MTQSQETLWEFEKRSWLEGEEFYQARPADGAVTGLHYSALLMDRDPAIEAMAQAPRRREVQFSQTGFRQRGGTAVLSYRAAASRMDDEAPYRAICASTHMDDPHGGWMMMSQCQQPDGPGA